ncbi:MAG: SDR family oxidoreductase, partial [Rhodospirillales bacterium]|nr:SDR family oxidoreductase [Rhodospirillales bacterium]
ITGSGQGIGFALAGALGGAGATVVLNGRHAGKLEQAASRLRAAGMTVELAPFDVTDQPAAAAGIARIEATGGPIDILVNNAGIQRRAPLEEFAVETWHELMHANLDSVFFVGQAVARGMIGRKRGKIINVCSVQSELGRPSIAPYAASKGGVKMLTKGMCADWARHGLQINGLAPGYFATELTQALVDNPEFTDWLCKRTPAGRWGRVEELGGAAIFLASAASDFVNGQILYVDGGMTSVV